MPDDWKRAIVSPISKKGARNRAENYRSINLTSIICKLMESFVKEVIVNHIMDKILLSSKQHGVISGRSTTTKLLKYLDMCIEKIMNGGVVDFEKAFDTVPHRRLIGKLESYGVSGNILNWIKAFLSGRSQIVKVKGVDSESVFVLSGIPQDSVLELILLIIHIDDLPEVITSDKFPIADDTKNIPPNYITARCPYLTVRYRQGQ